MREPPTGTVRVLLVLARSEGGIGRHVRTLADALREHDAKVVIAAPRTSIDALDLEGLDVEVVVLPAGGASLRSLRTTRRVLRTTSAMVDVVHAHGLQAGAACAASQLGVPLVVTWHNAAQGGAARRWSHAALARYVARRSDVTYAASEDLAASARAAGASQVVDMFVTAPPLPAPVRSAEQVRTALGVGDRPLVLAIGRLHRQKRFDVLVAAAAAWGSDPDSPYVVIAGDGPDHAELARAIAATSAPVALLGARKDISDLLGAATVVALPSEWEARALVAQEALRCGVALVTTAVGGLPSLVGAAAIVVPVGDSRALRYAIERLLGDRGLREQLVVAGREQASSWPTESEMVAGLLTTYLDLISRSRPD